MTDVTWVWRSWLMAFPWPSWNGGGLHGLKSATESDDEFTRGGSHRFQWKSWRLEDARCQWFGSTIIWTYAICGCLPSIRLARLTLQGPHCDSGTGRPARHRGSIQEQRNAAASAEPFTIHRPSHFLFQDILGLSHPERYCLYEFARCFCLIEALTAIDLLSSIKYESEPYL